MSKKYLFLITFALLAFAIIIPLFLCGGESILQIIDHISFIIAAICGLMTLVIAILLYDKYGVDKKIVDQNLEVVLHFVKELRNTNIYITGEGKRGYGMVVNLWNLDLPTKGDMMYRYMNDSLLFTLRYSWGFEELGIIRRDPFMPREIGVAFDKIQMTFCPENSGSKKDYERLDTAEAKGVQRGYHRGRECDFAGYNHR